MAKISQSESGIITLQKSQIEDNLYQFFEPFYLNTNEQYYATYILANLYYSSDRIHDYLLEKVNFLL